MNMTQMIGAMQNPQLFAMQQMMQQMIRENPQQWNAAKQMFEGKNQKQQRTVLEKLYKERGLDLNAVASQWGIQI